MSILSYVCLDVHWKNVQWFDFGHCPMGIHIYWTKNLQRQSGEFEKKNNWQNKPIYLTNSFSMQTQIDEALKPIKEKIDELMMKMKATNTIKQD